MSKNIKKLLSVVSIILCVTMLSSIPTQALAGTIEQNKDDSVYSSFDDVKGETEEIGNIIAEDQSARTEYSKEFLLDDGTKMVAEYDQPVHYQNDKGKWVDYDNSLVAENTIATADEANNNDYANKNSNIEVKLSNKAKKNNMIKVTSDNYSISWGYDNANKSKAKIVKDDTKLSGNDKFTTLKNLTSETLYEDVFKNVDLQYFVSSTGVKENIILKSSDVQNEFDITYKINNLTAAQKDDYTIVLTNKNGEEVYTISAPYMIDAKGETSTQLKLSIESQKGSNLNVKLTTDYWFIHSIGRSFPITIDPELTLASSKVTKLNEAYASGYLMNHGPYYIAKNGMIVETFSSLPINLQPGEQIISAKFNYTISNSDSLFENENEEPIIINAHNYTKSNGSPVVTCDETVLDYDSVSYNNNKDFTFDLTKLIKDWYHDKTDAQGFVLEAKDTVGSKQININDSSKKYPTLTLIYKDFSGTENSLSYHTIPVGQNAQASICDYLGNLVINQSLLEETGSRMPLSITATYNSINYNTTFENGSPSGYGWQFSFNQYVREVTDTNLTKAGYNYIYTDSDGTDHYLKFVENKIDEWADDGELGITLTKDDNNNIYIENGTTTQIYEPTANGGKLLSEKDEYNNTITYTYTDGNVTSITDGAGRVTSLSYRTNSSGEKRVSKIIKPDGTEIQFSYASSDKDKLSWVNFADGSASYFEYDENNRLVSITNKYYNYSKQLNKYIFIYNDEGQVTKACEYGSDNTEGNYLEIQYNNDNTTKFTDRQGRSETHTFDNSGTTVSVLNANGYISNSDGGALSIASGSDSYTKNYITQSTEQTEVKNDGYYYLSNGTKGSTTSSGGVVTIDTSAPSEEDGYYQYLGTTSLKVTNPKNSSNSAFFTAAAHEFNDTSFNGKDITFSAYVKTKNIEQIYSGGSVGASLKLKCLDANYNVVKEINSIGVVGTVDWQRLSVTANVPENTKYIRIYGMIRYASGTAWFDCLQLEEGNCANDFNALQNSDFESNDYWLTNENKSISANDGMVTIKGVSGTYDDVENTKAEENEAVEPSTYVKTETETEPNDSVVTYDDYGNVIKNEQGYVTRTVKKTYEVEATEATTEPDVEETTTPEDEVTDSTDKLGNKYIYQNVKVGRAGVTFNIYGEADAKSVPLSNKNRTFGIALNIYYKNNSVPETHYQEFNAATTAKQSVAMTVTPEDEKNEINYVAFAFVYSYNDNEITAYNAMLNISSTSVISNNKESSDSNSENSSDNDCVDYEVISESVDKSKTFMQTSSAYDSTGNYAISETDEAGNTKSYTYDINGNKTSVTDGEENVVNYTYDSCGNVTSVSSYDAKNTYSYTNQSTLSSIGHNGFSYKFNYDVFNNLISTKIGNVAIASNTYDSNNGNLTKTTYANGDYLEYSYDSYGNIVKITGENGTLAEYIYNKKGLVAKAVDNESDETTYYYYDFSGNLVNKYCQSENGDLNYYISTDADGNTVEKTNVDYATKTITYGTDEDGNSFVSNDGITVENKTDDFGRTTQVKTSRGEGKTVFFTDYKYAAGKTANSTTNLVSKLTQKYGSSELINYEYSYDANGNITQIKENGKVVAKYTYDELNQLLWSADCNTGLYTSISYDNAGNILNVKEYGLSQTSWSPLSLKQEKTYSYTDTNWKDKLTKYNGKNITYDAMGNPLSYRDGMSFTWQNGRILKQIKTANDTIVMKYNANGMRTQKDNSDYTVDYYYDSKNNLIGLNSNGAVLYFYYDSDGNVTSFSYAGSKYYYVKNLQGDVVKIINESGTTVVTYTYDAWGKILNQTDKTYYNLANLNPFKYRSYVYDYDTGLYYLQSRYYDPITGRFLNADDTAYIGATGTVLSGNLFTYCENNPVNNLDSKGQWLARLICGVAGAVVFGTVANVFCRLLGVDTSTRRWITAGFAALGGVLGAIFGPSLLAKFAPKALKWIQSIEKSLSKKFKPFSGKHCIIGIVINGKLKIMLHYPHHGKGYHIAIEHKTLGGRWRKTIPDIEIKKIGKKFLKWIGRKK